jgi:hypothetical protein
MMSATSDTTSQDINLAMVALKLGSKDFINNLPNELLLRIVEFADAKKTPVDEQRDRHTRVAVNTRWANMWKDGTCVIMSYGQASRFLCMLKGNVGKAQRITRFELKVHCSDWSRSISDFGRGWKTFDSLFESLPNINDLKLTIVSPWPGNERMARSLAGLTKMRKFNFAFEGASNRVVYTLDYLG